MAVLSGQARAFYAQTNLVSDLPGLAEFTDPNLVNPWGMALTRRPCITAPGSHRLWS